MTAKSRHSWKVLVVGLAVLPVLASGPSSAQTSPAKTSPAQTTTPAVTDPIPVVVARQAKPARDRLDQNVKEILAAFEEAGKPFSPDEAKALASTNALPDDLALGKVQLILDKHVILIVKIDDEGWMTLSTASHDPDDRALVKGQWNTFLVKVDNQSRITSPFEVSSMQAVEEGKEAAQTNRALGGTCPPQDHGWSKWFRLRMIETPLRRPVLSGTEIEYFPLQICSLDAGDRAAQLTFFLGGGQVSQGHYGTLGLFFRPVEQAAHLH